MNEFEFDYYYDSQQAEIDAIVGDAVDKITNIITGQAKTQIDEQLQKANQIQEQYDKDKRIWGEVHNRESACITELTNELNSLKEQYNKQRTEIPALEFEIGDKVWHAHLNYHSEKLVCPTCQGKGIIQVALDEYGKVDVTCPHCKGSTWGDGVYRYIEYNTYYPELTTIDYAEVEISKVNNEQRIITTYHTKTHSGSMSHSYGMNEVFATKEECQKYCEELNKKAYEEAKKHIYQGESK